MKSLADFLLPYYMWFCCFQYYPSDISKPVLFVQGRPVDSRPWGITGLELLDL